MNPLGPYVSMETTQCSTTVHAHTYWDWLLLYNNHVIEATCYGGGVTVECSGGYSKIEFDQSGCVCCVGEGKFQKLDQTSFQLHCPGILHMYIQVGARMPSQENPTTLHCNTLHSRFSFLCRFCISWMGHQGFSQRVAPPFSFANFFNLVKKTTRMLLSLNPSLPPLESSWLKPWATTCCKIGLVARLAFYKT